MTQQARAVICREIGKPIVVETVSVDTSDAKLDMAKQFGATHTVNPKHEENIVKTLKGSYFGSARPQQDFPRLIGLYRGGRLKLDQLITRTYTIEEAPQAFAGLTEGRNARGVILF